MPLKNKNKYEKTNMEKNYSLIKEIPNFPKIPLGKANDLRGQKFGRLTPLYRTNPLTTSQRCAYWLTQCDCGNYYVTRASSMVNGSTKSCGCYNKEATSERNFNNISGQKFGRLTAIALTKDKYYVNKPNNYWECICDCGNRTIVSYSSLVNNITKSCGCLQKEKTRENNKKLIHDLTGKRFGKLTVLKQDPKKSYRLHWICKCDCGNITSVAANALIEGRTVSCGCYSLSKGEENIVQILKQNNISFQQEISFLNLFDKKKLRFDFGIYQNNQLQYLIEYDGIQHFQITGGRGTLEQLQLTQHHDNLKNEWCKNNNIPLIRIPYTQLNNLCIKDLLLETSEFRIV